MNIPCRFCGEDIAEEAIKCKHCGEFVADSAPESKGLSTVVIVVLVVAVLGICGVCFISVIAAIAIPNLIEARKNGNETAAMGALKTFGAAQALFREADKEGDGNLDYGTLGELSNTNLIDTVLGSGTKQGYLFTVQASASTPEFLWMATANPALPDTTGDRYFVTNHEGVTYYSTTGPAQLNDACTIPPGFAPIGR